MIAVIGSRYAGLTFANIIKSRSNIEIQIFESLHPPHVGVLVGDVQVTFAEILFANLGIEWKWAKKSHSIPEEELLTSLRNSVSGRIKYRARVIALASEQDGIYLSVAFREVDGDFRYGREGPFQLVVAANGAKSTFRDHNIDRLVLIGDARWVGSRWWDLGARRLLRGADIAMQDALSLAEIVLANQGMQLPHLSALEKYRSRKKNCILSCACLWFSFLVAIYAIVMSRKNEKSKKTVNSPIRLSPFLGTLHTTDNTSSTM